VLHRNCQRHRLQLPTTSSSTAKNTTLFFVRGFEVNRGRAEVTPTIGRPSTDSGIAELRTDRETKKATETDIERSRRRMHGFGRPDRSRYSEMKLFFRSDSGTTRSDDRSGRRKRSSPGWRSRKRGRHGCCGEVFQRPRDRSENMMFSVSVVEVVSRCQLRSVARMRQSQPFGSIRGTSSRRIARFISTFLSRYSGIFGTMVGSWQ